MQQSNAVLDTQPVLTARKAQVAPAPRRQLAPAAPCAMVIFGAGGDLTKRLVVPALYNLAHAKMLPENFTLIGVNRGQGTVESWRDHLYEALKGSLETRRASSTWTTSTKPHGSDSRRRCRTSRATSTILTPMSRSGSTWMTQRKSIRQRATSSSILRSPIGSLVR